MEQAASAANASRRNEDIALDLLKFVAVSTGVDRAAASSTGFVASSAVKPEDHVDQLLELYAKCLRTVEGKGEAR